MSTAKSMAAQYKRNKLYTPASGNFKSSTSNLSVHSSSSTKVGSRLKATSMTNLIVDGHQENPSSGSRIQRPASRSALDSIHNGMNAKYAQVQSKVYLQNIKPQAAAASSQQASKIPANARRNPTTAARPHVPAGSSRQLGQQQDRQSLAAKVKSLQEELEALAGERDELRLELEREKTDKAEQLQQVKQELQEKLIEHDKQNEEYHQKLLEAYELADQNRRAADSVLAESRQRDEEARKKIGELESQLGELKEFIGIKDEMAGKMAELREQIREERERYEEQLKSLHQVFENEKIRLEMDLMDKVRQVGENYELNKYKSLNKTIELDARLANERLFATKLRLNQVSSMNDKLHKQLRSIQQQFQTQEKKLLLAETMLKQLVDQRLVSTAELTGEVTAKRAGRLARLRNSKKTVRRKVASHQQTNNQQVNDETRRELNESATQTPPTSRARTIINDLRQRLNLSSSSNSKAGAKGEFWSNVMLAVLASARNRTDQNNIIQVGQISAKGLEGNRQPTMTSDAAMQTGGDEVATNEPDPMRDRRQRLELLMADAGEPLEDNDAAIDEDGYDDDDYYALEADNDDHLYVRSSSAFAGEGRPVETRVGGWLRRASVSLDDILAGGFVHEAPTGHRIVISRGWPAGSTGRAISRVHQLTGRRAVKPSSRAPPRRAKLDEVQKRRLLMQFLKRSASPAIATRSRALVRLGDEQQIERAIKLRAGSAQRKTKSNGRRPDIIVKYRNKPAQVQYELPVHLATKPIAL